MSSFTRQHESVVQHFMRVVIPSIKDFVGSGLGLGSFFLVSVEVKREDRCSESETESHVHLMRLIVHVSVSCILQTFLHPPFCASDIRNHKAEPNSA